MKEKQETFQQLMQ